MKKIYNTPMLQVVSIKKNDIITMSVYGLSGFGSYRGVDSGTNEADAPDRFDRWDIGY